MTTKNIELTIDPGRVIWITGLAGAGKTTLGRSVYARLYQQAPNTVYLDGDHIREVFGKQVGYTPEDRLAIALFRSRLCMMLSKQGIDVVCTTISLFKQCHTWNRAHIPCYFEVFLDVPMEILYERDTKGLYSQAQLGKIKNVVGVDMPFDKPEKPHLTLDSSGVNSIESLTNTVFNQLEITFPKT